jgi:hypothetical protein
LLNVCTLITKCERLALPMEIVRQPRRPTENGKQSERRGLRRDISSQVAGRTQMPNLDVQTLVCATGLLEMHTLIWQRGGSERRCRRPSTTRRKLDRRLWIGQNRPVVHKRGRAERVPMHRAANSGRRRGGLSTFGTPLPLPCFQDMFLAFCRHLFLWEGIAGMAVDDIDCELGQPARTVT